MIGIGIAIAALVGVIALVAAIGIISSRYKKVGPNEVLIISGRKRTIAQAGGGTQVVGYRVVRNGGTFVWPVLEKIGRMSLESRKVPVGTEAAMSKEGVEIQVQAFALVKVASDERGIANAAERYLGKEADIVEQIRNVLEGHLRGVCGTLTPEEIYKDRQAFQIKIAEQAQPDLQQLGITMDTLTIQDIRDKKGYLEALGQKRTAEVLRDARVGKAIADQEATVSEVNARKISETAKADREAEISQAQKDMNVKKAQYNAETNKEQATAAQAGPKAEAKAQQEVAEAKTELAKKKAEQRQEELVAEVIKPAEAEKRKVVVDAEAAKSKKVLEAEGDKEAKMKLAEAGQYELRQEGEGEAAKVRNIGTAEADVVRLKGQAEADAVKAKLLAEAEGWQKRAEAMKAYSDAAMALELGQRLIAELPAMIQASASALGAVNKIEVFDFGGTGSPTTKLMGLAPEHVLKTLTWLKEAVGVDVAGILKGVQTKLSGTATDPVEETGKTKVTEDTLPRKTE